MGAVPSRTTNWRSRPSASMVVNTRSPRWSRPSRETHRTPIPRRAKAMAKLDSAPAIRSVNVEPGDGAPSSRASSYTMVSPTVRTRAASNSSN